MKIFLLALKPTIKIHILSDKTSGVAAGEGGIGDNGIGLGGANSIHVDTILIPKRIPVKINGGSVDHTRLAAVARQCIKSFHQDGVGADGRQVYRIGNCRGEGEVLREPLGKLHPGRVGIKGRNHHRKLNRGSAPK